MSDVNAALQAIVALQHLEADEAYGLVGSACLHRDAENFERGARWAIKYLTHEDQEAVAQRNARTCHGGKK